MEIVSEWKRPLKNRLFKFYERRGNRIDYFSDAYDLSVVTTYGDTLIFYSDKSGYVTIDKGIKIAEIWVKRFWFESKNLILKKDDNYFVIIMDATRQFEDEEWKIEPDGSLRPKDSRGRLADYVLKKYSEEAPDSMDFPINRIKRWAEKIKTDKRMSDIIFIGRKRKQMESIDVYHYYTYVKDYQGNIRLIVDENNKVVESNEYYPYGMPRHAVGESSQPYKFGGKESRACRLGVIGIML